MGVLGSGVAAQAQVPCWSAAIGVSTAATSGAPTALTVDAVGDQYVTGGFLGTIQLGSTVLTAVGGSDAFVAKRDGRTGAWLWAVRVGGSGDEQGNSLAVDHNGNVVVTGGFTTGITFATTPATTLTGAGSNDLFVARFSAATGACQWAFGTGSRDLDYSFKVAVDSQGDAVVAGFFNSSIRFNGSPAITLTGASSRNVFVAKFTGATGACLWAVGVNGSVFDVASSLALDAGGNVLVSGTFTAPASITFATTPVTTLTPTGFNDSFVAKLAGATGACQWATQIGGTGTNNTITTGLAVDGQGNAIVAGFFTGTSIAPTSPATTLTSAGDRDVFVAKFAAATGACQWGVQAGSSSSDYANTVAVDGSGDALVTGSFFNEADFGGTRLFGQGNYDIFVTKLAGATGNFDWAIGAGGFSDDGGSSLVVDNQGRALVSGTCRLATSFGPHVVTVPPGNQGTFLATIDGAGTPLGLPGTAAPAAFSLSPNPARGVVRVTGATAPLTVVDLTGRVVRTQAQPSATLDLAGLPAGVYVVRAGSLTQRLAVE